MKRPNTDGLAADEDEDNMLQKIQKPVSIATEKTNIKMEK